MDVDALYTHLFSQDSDLMKRVFEERKHESKNFNCSDLAEILHTCSLGKYLGMFLLFFENFDFWGLGTSISSNFCCVYNWAYEQFGRY